MNLRRGARGKSPGRGREKWWREKEKERRVRKGVS